MSQYFATVARGLEELAAQELTELGAQDVAQGFCGLSSGKTHIYAAKDRRLKKDHPLKPTCYTFEQEASDPEASQPKR